MSRLEVLLATLGLPALVVGVSPLMVDNCCLSSKRWLFSLFCLWVHQKFHKLLLVLYNALDWQEVALKCLSGRTMWPLDGLKPQVQHPSIHAMQFLLVFYLPVIFLTREITYPLGVAFKSRVLFCDDIIHVYWL